MSRWSPRATVATVIVQQGKYLMVEERDKTTGILVLNQPAGHLEEGETLQQAALRETREETGWEILLEGVLGVALYTAPANGLTYHRTTFLASPLAELENARLDPDILCTHWMDYEEILANSAKMRSPLVLTYIDKQRQGHCFPLSLIDNT